MPKIFFSVTPINNNNYNFSISNVFLLVSLAAIPANLKSFFTLKIIVYNFKA